MAEQEYEAVRYCGELKIELGYDDSKEWYFGKITTYSGAFWTFENLKPPAMWSRFGGPSVDSAEAFDAMAESAVAFGGYYTTYNRGDDLPEWSPPAEVADEIENQAEYGDSDRVIRRDQ